MENRLAHLLRCRRQSLAREFLRQARANSKIVKSCHSDSYVFGIYSPELNQVETSVHIFFESDLHWYPFSLNNHVPKKSSSLRIRVNCALFVFDMKKIERI